MNFETTDDAQDILPVHAMGAFGWMFSSGRDEDEACDFIRRDLAHHNLHVVEIDSLTEIFDPAEVEQFDEILAQNVLEFESGHKTAWGTLHTYLAEGES